MAEYVASALFVYTDNTKHLIEPLQNNSSGTRITSVAFETLMQTPQKQLEGVDHVVVAGALAVIKEILFGHETPFQHWYHPNRKTKTSNQILRPSQKFIRCCRVGSASGLPDHRFNFV